MKFEILFFVHIIYVTTNVVSLPQPIRRQAPGRNLRLENGDTVKPIPNLQSQKPQQRDTNITLNAEIKSSRARRDTSVDSQALDFNNFTPKCHSHKLYCTEIENYPEEYLRAILPQEAKKFYGLFGEDMLVDDPSVVQRIDLPGEESLCFSREHKIFPKSLPEASEGNLMRLVVQSDNYKQGIRIETCFQIAECASNVRLGIGYTAECQQRYLNRQLVTLDNNGNLTTTFFKIPSCCKCVIKSQDLNNQN